MQKFATFALVGLVALFPVFNQVALSSIEALTDADHQAKFQDFFKDWGDIPEDEKLSYWDGRNQPPGGSEGFDRDRLDDDARIDGNPKGPDGNDAQDRDGDGVPDDQDADPEDPEVGEGKVEWHQIKLWECPCRAQGIDQVADANPNNKGIDFDWVNVTLDYDGFTGSATFVLTADGTQIWSETVQNNAGVYAVGAQGSDSGQTEDVGTADLQMDIDYQPLGDPTEFTVEVWGAYRTIEEA